MHWRGRTLRAVRRHLRQIEVQTHRLRAKIARLEADHEEDVADYLDGDLDRTQSLPNRSHESGTRSAVRRDSSPASVDSDAAVIRQTEATVGRVATDEPSATNVFVLDPHEASRLPPSEAIPSFIAPRQLVGRARGPRAVRDSKRPLLVSVGVHVALLLVCLPLSYVTLTNQSVFLLASPPELMDESTVELTSVEIDTSLTEDLDLQNVAPDVADFNLSDSRLEDVTPLDSLVAAENTATFGQSDAMPNDLGTLMAGVGKPDGGQAGGPSGSAIFFGAKSQGDRFVFVVDNSDSMNDGRLENAIAELTRCVEALSRRQSFYVIFVSDQVYPMFYPDRAPGLLPATAENKRRLAEWLPRAQRASGKNRELITALDLAASLQPDAVFFLWDGRIDHAGVRRDVMAHLTRPNQWNFPVHTLGMGVVTLDSEYNLSTIARANGGTYRRIELPTMPPPK